MELSARLRRSAGESVSDSQIPVSIDAFRTVETDLFGILPVTGYHGIMNPGKLDEAVQVLLYLGTSEREPAIAGARAWILIDAEAGLRLADEMHGTVFRRIAVDDNDVCACATRR